MSVFRVEKAKITYNGGVVEDRYCITENRIPMLTISQWIDNVSLESILTGKHYAYTFVGFLRYLDSIGLSYKEVKSKVVIWNYMKKLIYEDKRNNIISIESQKSHNSIYHSINIICNFYFWLDQFVNGVVNTKKIMNFKDIPDKYAYKDIWGTKFFNRSKGQGLPFKLQFKRKRDSYRWYTDEEIECFKTGFKTKRDLAIFLISIEGGCRIEEILTIKHYDYFPNENKFWISESKTIQRYCFLPQYVCEVINDYLSSEKFNLEINMDKVLDDYLFVNIKKGKNQGGKVNQDNYRKILKRAGKRVGLNPDKIITHAGRSTKAQLLIESGCSDFEIMELMGWASIQTVESYRKQFSPEFSKSISEKIVKHKRKK